VYIYYTIKIKKGIHQVKVEFSRHAKRRAKLYKIPESTVIKILEGIELSQGEHEIIEDVIGFEVPLKIAVAVEGEIVTVITNYPLKKGRKQ